LPQPTPAIIAQSAVRQIPRIALLLLCLAYTLAGFLGRDPWKNADITAFGYMTELAHGKTDWLAPQLLGASPTIDALLPYWLGAWFIQIAPHWISPDLAARLPFIALLLLSFLALWYGSYHLAQNPEAQPLAFAFGGEAKPSDYARAIADGSLLAFMASLGLAQLAHETTPAMAQLFFATLGFYGFAALPYRRVIAVLSASLGLLGLALSGAPTLAILFGLGGVLIHGLDRSTQSSAGQGWPLAILVAALVLIGLLSWALDLWHWRITILQTNWQEWKSHGRLLLWFTWPTWPLVLWTLWHWRRQLVRQGLPSRHLAWPVWLALVALAAALSTAASDWCLLLALPALAALAAFALPTLKRSIAALIDWFTLLFFSGCAAIVWVVWIALQTGVPQQPAANVARLVPGFVHHFSPIAFVLALVATLAWAWLVAWRVGRHRNVIWKSLVLPASGAALSWLLLMTLWLPMLNYARSYAPMVHQAVAAMQPSGCVKVFGLNDGQVAAFRFHGNLALEQLQSPQACNWLMVGGSERRRLERQINLANWRLLQQVGHPADPKSLVLIYQRQHDQGERQ
jgi:hypothetical protein